MSEILERLRNVWDNPLSPTLAILIALLIYAGYPLIPRLLDLHAPPNGFKLFTTAAIICQKYRHVIKAIGCDLRDWWAQLGHSWGLCAITALLYGFAAVDARAR